MSTAAVKNYVDAASVVAAPLVLSPLTYYRRQNIPSGRFCCMARSKEQLEARKEEVRALGKYIESICKARGVEPKRLCSDFHLGPDCVRSMIDGHEPSLFKVEKIAEVFKLPLDELVALMRPGSCGLAERETPALIGGTASRHPPEGYMAIYPAPGGGRLGGGEYNEANEEPIWLQTALIRGTLGGEAADFFWVEIVGTAMAPDLAHGDRVLIDRRAVEPIQPGMFVVDEGIGLTTRWVEYIPGSAPRRYRIRFGDTRSVPCEVSADQIKILGRVAWMSRCL